MRTVALAAALENQAARVYQTIETTARAGRLGASVPAFAAFTDAVAKQHTKHADMWNAILRDARKPAVPGAPLSDQAAVMSSLTSASTVAAVASIALQLENRLAQTCVAAAGTLRTSAALAAAASTAPVNAMHAATLGFIFGTALDTGAFLGSAAAAHVSQLTA